ncbi:MAG: hypothetical protein AB8B85_19170, partial [Paracoccaceae bacterium]
MGFSHSLAYILTNRTSIKLTDDEISAIERIADPERQLQIFLANAEQKYQALEGATIRDSLFETPINVQSIGISFEVFEDIGADILHLFSAIEKLTVHFGVASFELSPVRALVDLKRQLNDLIADVEQYSEVSSFGTFLDTTAEKFGEGATHLVSIGDIVFKALTLTRWNPAQGVSDQISLLGTAVGTIGTIGSDTPAAIKSLYKLSGLATQVLTDLLQGTFDPLTFAQFKAETILFLDIATVEDGASGRIIIGQLGTLAGIVSDLTDGIKALEFYEASAAISNSAPPAVSWAFELASERFLLESINKFGSAMAQVASAVPLPDVFSNVLGFVNSIFYTANAIDRIDDTTTVELLYEAGDLAEAFIDDIYLGVAALVETVDLEVAVQPEVVAFNVAARLENLSFEDVEGASVLSDFASILDSALIGQAADLLSPGDRLIYAYGDQVGAPLEVLFIDENGRLSVLTGREVSPFPGAEFAFQTRFELAWTTAAAIEAIASQLNQSFPLGEAPSLASFLTGGGLLGGSAVLTIPADESQDAVVLTEIETSQTETAQIIRLDPTPPTPGVIDIETPVTPPPPPVGTGVDLTGASVRSVELSIGDDARTNGSASGSDAFVWKVSAASNGKISVAVTLWGGAKTTVMLLRDVDLNGRGDTSEALQSAVLSFAGTTEATLDLDGASFGDYYLVATTEGAPAEITAEASLLSVGSSESETVAPVIATNVDEFTDADPGSIDDDGAARFARINTADDSDPIDSNVLVGGQSYLLRVEGFAGNNDALSDFRVDVFDANGAFIGDVQSGSNGLGEFTLPVPVGSSGAYRFGVTGLASATGDYLISLENLGATPVVDDFPDSTGTPAALGQPMSAYVSGPGDTDTFSYMLQEGHKYTLLVTPISGQFPPLTHTLLKIRNPDDSVLDEVYRAPTTAFQKQFIASSSGMFDIDIGSTLASGSVQLQLVDNGLVVPPQASLTTAADQGGLDTDIAYDDPVYISGTMPASGHRYLLDAAPGGQVSVYVRENGSQFGSLNIQLFNDAGQQVVPDGSFNIPNNGTHVFYRVPVEFEGGLQVVVGHNQASNSNFAYQIAAQLDDELPDHADDAFALQFEVPVSGHVESSAYDDVFDISGLSGAVSFDLSGAVVPP